MNRDLLDAIGAALIQLRLHRRRPHPQYLDDAIADLEEAERIALRIDEAVDAFGEAA